MAYIDIDYDGSVSVDIDSFIGEIPTEELRKELNKRSGKIESNVFVAAIKTYINEDLGSHDVKEVFDYIRESYHYDVFKGELDEKVN